LIWGLCNFLNWHRYILVTKTKAMKNTKVNMTDFVLGMSQEASQEFQKLKKELFLSDGVTPNTEAQKDNSKVYKYNCLASERAMRFITMQN